MRLYSLGTTVIEGGVHFSIDAGGESCNLMLYQTGQEETACVIAFPEEERIGDVWSMTVLREDFAGLEYCYEVDGVLISDPYGFAFSGREEWGNPELSGRVLKSPVISESFDWEGDKPLNLPFQDCIFYKIHPRGFTKHQSSGVKKKGTFAGIIEKIPYLKELGITTLELMPVVEFQEMILPGGLDGNPYGISEPTGKINYWGYGSGFYFAPKSSYCAGRRKHPVHEFKSLVKALHMAGLEIVIELFFQGNEHSALILDAVRFWVQEYHVDGIHLVGADRNELIKNDPYLSQTKLLANTWDGYQERRKKHLAEYNDGFMVSMRRFLKGDEDQLSDLIFRSKRNPDNYGVVNYMANANGFTLMDMVSYDRKHNDPNGERNQDGSDYNYSWNCGVEGGSRKKKITELRKKQIRNAVLLLFLSQGTPLLLSGDEFGHTKLGNNNSYCQDNAISWVNWNLMKSNHDIYEFVKSVIAFRKKHPIFHMEREPRVMDYLACGHPDVSYHGVKAWYPEFENFRRELGILYCGKYAKKPDGTEEDYFFVVYNMHWENHKFALPNLPKKFRWYVVFNTDMREENGMLEERRELPVEDQKSYHVPARTIVVLIGK